MEICGRNPERVGYASEPFQGWIDYPRTSLSQGWALATLGSSGRFADATLKGLAMLRTLSGLDRLPPNFFVPGLPKLNPGLEFANAFGVEFFLRDG